MMLASVGPLSLGEHAVWFAVLSLFVFLIYNGLRTESVKQAASLGARRWLVFLGGSVLLAGASGLLAHFL